MAQEEVVGTKTEPPKPKPLRVFVLKVLSCVVILAALALVGCGGAGHPQAAVKKKAVVKCVPPVGQGVAGVCAPHQLAVPEPRFASQSRLIPDVSEFQGCALHSEAIVRVYEAGTDRKDTNAACHFRELRRKHVWSAAYFFARPPGFGRAPGCKEQARRATAIAKSLGVVGPIIDDAEVPLPRGFVRCVKSEIERLHFPAVEYTCPGCGDEQVGRIWIASVPTRPRGHWVAHQFSFAFNCRGVFGDCSVNEGITSIRRAHPKPKPKPLTPKQKSTKLKTLNRLLGAYDKRKNPHGHNCQHPPFRHAYPNARFNHACDEWAKEKRKLS